MITRCLIGRFPTFADRKHFIASVIVELFEDVELEPKGELGVTTKATPATLLELAKIAESCSGEILFPEAASG